MSELKVENEEELTTFQKSIALLISITAFGLGLFVIIGWSIGSEWLITPYPGLPGVSFNTGILFIATSLSIACLIFNAKRTAAFLSLFVIGFSGSFVVQYYMGIDLGINDFFFRKDTNLEPKYTKELSIYTSLSFGFLGLSILSLAYKRFSIPYIWLPGVFSSLILIVCVIGLYRYGEEYEPDKIVYIAAYTVMGLILLYIAVLLFATSIVSRQLPKAVHFWVSALITLGIMTIVAIFYFSFLFEQKQTAARDIKYMASDISRYISGRISDVVNVTLRASARYKVAGPELDTLWEVDAKSFDDTLLGYRAMMLVNEKREIVKLDYRAGFAIDQTLPILLPALKRETERNFTIRSLTQRQMFVIQYPVGEDRIFVSLFDVESLFLVSMSPEALAKFDLLVLFGGNLLCNTFMYSIYEKNRTYEPLLYRSTIAGSELLVYLWPQVSFENRYRGMMPTMLMASGSLLALFVGFLFYLIQKFKGLGEELHKANEAKTQFLANVSHEVRTPLHGIIGTASLMRNTELHPKQVRYLEIISSSSQHLLSLINNLLDITKVQSGSFTFVPQPCSAEAVCKEVTQMVMSKAREKNLDIDLKFVQDSSIKEIKIPVQVLKQILINLLGNAIKFTDKGKITLSVKISDTAEGAVMDIAVKDTGIGIPKDRYEVIFKKFSQVETQMTSLRGGTGLGLYLTKAFVEKLKGKIWFESAPDVGSTFFVQIPVEKYDGK